MEGFLSFLYFLNSYFYVDFYNDFDDDFYYDFYDDFYDDDAEQMCMWSKVKGGKNYFCKTKSYFYISTFHISMMISMIISMMI